MQNKINHIIARILSGEGSLEDTLLLSEWLNKDEKNKKTFSQMKIYWDAEVAYNNTTNPEALLLQIRKKIENRRKKTYRKWQVLIPAAAIIMAVIVTTSSVVYIHRVKENYTNDRQEYYTYLTNENKSFFTLADGTKITLNKYSRLTFSNKYGSENRSVKLNGEAFFEVTKNPETTFEVAFETGTEENACIKVLGTTFSARLDADRERIIATLVEGSICFEAEDQKITMAPNQQVEFNYSTLHIDIRTVDTETEVAWKEGIIRYKTIVFSDLIKELESVYETSIVIQNQKFTSSSITVSGAFDEKQSLEEVLQVIARSLPIKWHRKNNIYFIR